MNYAEDRLDRHNFNNAAQSSHHHHHNLMIRLSRMMQDDDSSSSSSTGDNNNNKMMMKECHQQLARYLRDIGLNLQAAFHYAVVWLVFDRYNSQAAGDYAQMLEFCGSPELGVTALIKFYELLKTNVNDKETTKADQLLSLLLLRRRRGKSGEICCECGFDGCCYNLSTFLQFHNDVMISVQNQSRDVDGQCYHEWVQMNVISIFTDNNNESVVGGFTPLLKILLMKLLYVSSSHHLLQSQASEDNNENKFALLKAACTAMSLFQVENDHLKHDHKSHWAYYVFMKVLILRKVKSAKFLPIFKRNIERTAITPPQPLYIVGDSHILSAAWQCISLKDGSIHRTVTPVLVPGIKAWHFRLNTKFFTNTNLNICLQKLSEQQFVNNDNCQRKQRRTILLSAGEIDCREGIGRERLEGYNNLCEDAVINTVTEFVTALEIYSVQHNIQILLLPVAPHGRRTQKKGKVIGREMRRKRMVLWNKQLRKLLSSSNTTRNQTRSSIYFLDYWEDLSSGGAANYILHDKYNADFTHMNSNFIKLLERAIEECGCNLDML